MLKKILDFGCGNGFRALSLGRRGEYWGVDISSENIARAKKSYTGKEFLLLTGNKLPFEDAFFDEIYAYEVLEHVFDLSATVVELKRCLKKGGRLIVEAPYYKSEKLLLRVHPTYWKEIGHLRLIDEKIIGEIFVKAGFNLGKKQKKKGIDNFLLIYYFMSGRSISKQTGEFDNENYLLRRVSYLFSEDFFDARMFRELIVFWILFPIWIITQPMGRILSWIFPKTIRYEFIAR